MDARSTVLLRAKTMFTACGGSGAKAPRFPSSAARLKPCPDTNRLRWSETTLTARKSAKYSTALCFLCAVAPVRRIGCSLPTAVLFHGGVLAGETACPTALGFLCAVAPVRRIGCSLPTAALFHSGGLAGETACPTARGFLCAVAPVRRIGCSLPTAALFHGIGAGDADGGVVFIRADVGGVLPAAFALAAGGALDGDGEPIGRCRSPVPPAKQ